jgi:hypothetical protein
MATGPIRSGRVQDDIDDHDFTEAIDTDLVLHPSRVRDSSG